MIYEHVIKFKYKCFTIKCWIPAERYVCINHQDKIKEYLEFIKNKLKELTRQDWRDMEKEGYIDYNNLAEKLAENFNMNSCEIINSKNGCGGIVYNESLCS